MTTLSPGSRHLNDNSHMSDYSDKKKPNFFSFLLDEAKIEKYIKIIEYEMKKHNYSMDQRCFIENMIKILDSISKVI